MKSEPSCPADILAEVNVNNRLETCATEVWTTLDQFKPTIDTYFSIFQPRIPVLTKDMIYAEYARPPEQRPRSFFKALRSMYLMTEVRHKSTPEVDEMDAVGVLPFSCDFGALVKESNMPSEELPLDIYAVLTSYHISCVWDMLGRRKPAYYRLQEAITLAQMLPVPPIGDEQLVATQARLLSVL